MKLNRQNLLKLILEVMEDDELSPRSDFEKLMSALTSDLSNARQAWEMYDLGAYELSPEEEAKAKEAMVRVIVTDSEEPARDLFELDYDFHGVFKQAFGFTPPMSKEFKLWGGVGGSISEELSLRTTVDGKDVEFEFWWDLGTRTFDQDVLIEPWFRFETKDEQDGYVTFEKGVISIDEGDDYLVRTSKEQLPGALRSAMGIPWDADLPEWPELPKGSKAVNEKLDRLYLLEMIGQVLEEDDDDDNYATISSKIDTFIASKDLQYYMQGYEITETYGYAGLIEDEEADELKRKIIVAAINNDLHETENAEDVEFGETTISWVADGLHSIVSDKAGELRKIVEMLGDVDFAVDVKNNRILIGPVAEAYANFARDMEEIFGATPSGDVDVVEGFDVITSRWNSSGPINVPMGDDREMKVEIIFERSADEHWGLRYGMQITMYGGGVDYGVYVFQENEGPNAGKLKIGIQDMVDEMEENKIVKNKDGGFGFSKEEMIEKILEMTGVKISEIK